MKKIISALFLILAVTLFAVTKSSAIEFSVGVSGNTSAYGAFAKETNTTAVTEEYGAFMDQKPSVFVEGALNDVVSIGLEYTIGDITTPQNTNEQDDQPHGSGTSASSPSPGPAPCCRCHGETGFRSEGTPPTLPGQSSSVLREGVGQPNC